MNIYIDESGSFLLHPKEGSWSVVVAVCCPESSRRSISEAVSYLRRSRGGTKAEVKLRQLSEGEYIKFLENLAKFELILFAACTDSGLNTPDRVLAHQAHHVDDIRKNIQKMQFEGGRQSMTLLAKQLESLPPQLYVQLITQVNLAYDVIDRGINFYVQRKPITLREFRWRVDQKDTKKNVFQEIFEKYTPPLLQARSIQEPMLRIKQFDYSYLAAYEFEEGQSPDYLQSDYGLPPMEGLNVQKLLRGNLKFVNSECSDGVQVADLLASGLARVLKGKFDSTSEIAHAIGRLCVQNVRGKHAINLISFGGKQPLSQDTSSILRHIDNESKQFLR